MITALAIIASALWILGPIAFIVALCFWWMKKDEYYSNGPVPTMFFGSSIWLLIGLSTMSQIYACFDGINPNYTRNGEIMGYVADVWNEGMFWDTYELRMYELHPYHERVTFRFSMPDDRKDLAEVLYNNIGKYVVVQYRRWWFSPHRIGETNYEIMSVRPLSDEEVNKVATWRLSME